MTPAGIVFMLLILASVWGGFAFCLWRNFSDAGKPGEDG